MEKVTCEMLQRPLASGRPSLSVAAGGAAVAQLSYVCQAWARLPPCATHTPHSILPVMSALQHCLFGLLP